MALIGSIGWVLGIIAAIWVIYDCLVVNRRISTLLKIIWVVLALVLSWGGAVILALIYYLIYKK
jgi:hypothetical protein